MTPLNERHGNGLTPMGTKTTNLENSVSVSVGKTRKPNPTCYDAAAQIENQLRTELAGVRKLFIDCAGKLSTAERERDEAKKLLDQILTDENYVGGVCFLVARNDASLLREAQLRADLAALRAKLATLLTAAEDMLSTYRHDDKTVVVTAERQEAWQQAVNECKNV